MSPATTAAFWSAAVASLSALVVVVATLIQRRNLLESVRPELVLVGWGRLARGQGDAAHEVITIESIKNVGRGAALHVHLNSMYMIENRPVAVLSTKRIPILAPNESAELGGEIILWRKNAQSASDKTKFIPINVQIYAWDSRGMRHETNYSLFAIELGSSCHIFRRYCTRTHIDVSRHNC